MSEDTFVDAVRVVSLQCMKMPDDVYDRWKLAAQQTQQIANFVWQRWLVWHFANGTRAKIVAHLEAFKAWKENGGEKPKRMEAIPKELVSTIYKELGEVFPTVHVRARDLIKNVIFGKIKNSKASTGNLSRWVAILLGNESLPSTMRENPIPFDSSTADIVPPADKDGHWALEVKVTRIPTDKKNSPSVVDTIQLWSHGRKAASQVATLRKIASGEWKFCGSGLVLSKSGKWFANICYRMSRDDAKTEPLDPAKTAVLSASTSWPWKLRIPRRNRRPGGRGFHVGNVRQRLLTQRWSRQASYRQAGSSRKGHGREHAQQITERLGNRWRDFVKTYNHQITTDVVQQCVANGIGRIVYYQPSGKFADSRFLANAGKVEGRHDASSWDWYQVGSMLGYKCNRAGIELVVRKTAECHGVAKVPAKKATKRVAKSAATAVCAK